MKEFRVKEFRRTTPAQPPQFGEPWQASGRLGKKAQNHCILKGYVLPAHKYDFIVAQSVSAFDNTSHAIHKFMGFGCNSEPQFFTTSLEQFTSLGVPEEGLNFSV